MTTATKDSREQAANRLAAAAGMFANGDLKPTTGAYYRNAQGTGFPFITNLNRNRIAECCLEGSIHVAAYDIAGAGNEKTGDWLKAALNALQNTKPTDQGIPDSLRHLPSISDNIVERHGPAKAAPILAAWLIRAAKSLATESETDTAAG